MILLSLVAAASINSPSATLVADLLERARAGDKSGFSKLAPDLKWEVVEGLPFSADFEDVRLFATGCDRFEFGEPRPVGTDGSMVVRGVANCEDNGPHLLNFDFTVRGGVVVKYLIKAPK